MAAQHALGTGAVWVHLVVNMTRTAGPDPAYDHNYALGSTVYRRIEAVDEAAARAVHDAHGRSPYVLSEIHRVSGQPLHAWFRVGTDDARTAQAISKAFTPGTEIAIDQTGFRVTGVEIDEPIVRPGEFVTLSPILLTDKESGRSVVHDTNGYHAFLTMAINAQIKNNTKSEGAVHVLNVEPQAVRKRTLKGRTVLAQKARLLLDGPEEELKFLVDRGIGKSPALGFGMVVGTAPWHSAFHRIREQASRSPQEASPTA